MNPKELPVYRQKKQILNGLQHHSVIVVESPTGSGKTTQIPVILHEAGYTKQGVVGVTQPRRIAALSVSDFISGQLQCECGSLVGYKMRFEDKTSSETLIKIMTDGILLQELKTDPLLQRYSVIMVDEAHERSLNIDFILGLLKQILTKRSDFKVIISSATINCRTFSDYFHHCPIVRIQTPVYPIELHYAPLPSGAEEAELYAQITAIVDRYLHRSPSNRSSDSGDILIFLQGEKNIKECIRELLAAPFADRLLINPLYGRLSKEEQEKVFIPTPKGKTKVVVSTNIAETSVTIDRISLVIDSGLAKINDYNPYTFTESLAEQTISRSSADQRKGRAGRTGPGICYRIYSADDYEHRPEFTLEEIYRTDLSEVILRMSDLGITDFENFDYLSPPKRNAIIGGVQTLQLLDAIDDGRHLTETGKRMVYFPLIPRHARILVEAIVRYPSVLEEAIIGTAFLSTHSPFLLPQGEEIEARLAHRSFRDPYGDFVSYLKIFKHFSMSKDKEAFCNRYYLDLRTMNEIANIKTQLEAMISEQGIPITHGGGIKDYLSAVSRGLIQFVCINDHQYTYRSMTAEKISIHPGSVLFKECPLFMVAGEIVKTSKMFARSVSPLKREWLNDIVPHLEKRLTALAKKKRGTADRTPAAASDSSDRRSPDGRTNGKAPSPRPALQPRSAPGAPAAGSGRADENEIRTGNFLHLAGHDIELIPHKGKKIARLPWPLPRLLSEQIAPEQFPRLNSVRGTVFFQGKKLWVDHKLPNILIAARWISPETDCLSHVNLSLRYDVIADPKPLFNRLEWILKLVPVNRKEWVSLALISEGDGCFRFVGNPSVMMSLDVSLNALEELMEICYATASNEQKGRFNRIYNRLTEMSRYRHWK